ncbi:TRAP transporter substrate-binding protein [Uliginosibacterium flavum]|uniref:TRAP transporter substrate-binding protein DctP n=1 Tax=Uliginosibacterium flavum TaxID=1396831 RepID=A0ABV2TFM7_9RHOO
MFKRFASLAVLALSLSISAQAADLTAWSPQPEEHPTTIALQGMLKRLKETSSRLDSSLMPVAAASNQNKLIAGLQSGEIGVAVITPSTVARLAPQARVLALPFLFRDSKQMFKQLDGEVGKELEQSMATQGVVLLGWYDGGTRSFYMRNRPPRSISDLDGLKVRIPNRADLRETVSALGGVPQVLAYQDVNAAFEAGNIDAAENDLLSYEADQHYKRAKFFVTTSHAVQYEALVVSAVVWNKLSDAERAGLREAGRDSALADREIWAKRMIAARMRLEKEGVKFVDQRDSMAFASRVTATYKPYMENPVTAPLLLKLMTAKG